jgi:hypothetical protein
MSEDTKKLVAKKTVDAYQHFALAGVVALPLVVGGPTVISTQQPIRKPDEHLASQAQPGEATQEASAFELSVQTTGTVQLRGQAIRASGGRLIGQLDVKSIN